jgi:1-deoxyxylulose-5-phosphate synthase
MYLGNQPLSNPKLPISKINSSIFMRQRILGRTGISVSELAFGGVEIGMPYGIGVNSAEHMISEKESIRLLQASLSAGINFFDTARLYGQSESIMGKAFRDRRSKVVIATKCKHLRDVNGKIPSWRSLKRMIDASWQESLNALQTEYVDVFMLHQSDMEILENEDIADIFAGLKRSGVIRATGASTYTAAETQKAIDTDQWDVIQLPFNLLNQEQETSFNYAAEKGIGIVIRSVLLKGLLSNRGSGLHPALKSVETHIGRYRSLLNHSYPDLPALAIKFALSFPDVASVLIGMDKLEYLSTSLNAAEGDYLDQQTLTKLKELAYPEPDFLNLAEWSKKGWLV